jgi:hypothetical protein
MATLGATAGLFTTLRGASACSCAPFKWDVRLREVTSSDPATNHREFWPTQGTLDSYKGYAHILAPTFTPGIIASAGAGFGL